MFRLRLCALSIIVLFAGMPLVGCDIPPITPPGINQDPTANAGADQNILVSERLEFNGRCSDFTAPQCGSENVRVVPIPT